MLLFVWAFTGGRGTTPPSWGAALRVALSGAGLPPLPSLQALGPAATQVVFEGGWWDV